MNKHIPTALYWNPAGSVNIIRPTAHFYHSPWIADVQFNHSAVVVPLDGSSSLGFFITSVTMDEMQVRTVKSPHSGPGYNSLDEYLIRPDYYSSPRQIKIGLSVNF